MWIKLEFARPGFHFTLAILPVQSFRRQRCITLSRIVSYPDIDQEDFQFPPPKIYANNTLETYYRVISFRTSIHPPQLLEPVVLTKLIVGPTWNPCFPLHQVVSSFGGISITETISPTWKWRNEIFSHCDAKHYYLVIYFIGLGIQNPLNSTSSCLLNMHLWIYEHYTVGILYVHKKKMLNSS